MVGFGEPVGELSQVVVECYELLVVLVQRTYELRQASRDRDEVPSTLVERRQRFRQAVQRVVDLFALASQVVRGRFDDLTERALRLLRCRAEVSQDPVDGVAQLVPLDGHL